ncbi:ser/thr protein phosphatase family [Purpureocillium lilacinum]|uniref:Ser/thr protein phosphatase family n=1 Tax=Purpureocillium lilacinum TaxID=33203 RepID=A0A179HZX8_PURLI|nr:ser/thr protein phosphatase family [Purpureocillium lilacinum]OAQ95111.1 ser/thr protein phosphatase family [Purpureocillium lilacinum]
MFRSLGVVAAGLVALAAPGVVGCGEDSCYGPTNKVEHVRQVKRMQPGAPGAAYGPKGPLEWGQVNFLHTTDTHGWLEGHLKEQNYGADWGDFVTFSRRMKQTAGNMGVDLLIVDTGDLHDGNGVSDATTPDGTKSMPIFTEIDYDLLTIGNHELYVSEVAYQMFNEYARKWGDKYVTSNVKVLNQTTGKYEYVGATHRYFTTPKGLRVMAFGVLFDFTGNSNASQVLKAKDMVKESWFTEALASKKPVDMFVLFGHNPVRQTDYASTFQIVFDAIRGVHAKTPVQIFGGHSHIRDFSVYDDSSVAIESGRYCETLGWMSMSGFDSSNSGFKGVKNPHGVKNPSRPAKTGSKSPFVYSRRYLDWNRKTFVYHSKVDEDKFDYHSGERVTGDIGKVRDELKLGDVYGCAPQDWCMSCAPFTDKKNIFPGVIYPAVSAIVLNKTRADKSRIILGNTGAIRFDLHKGPFTYDDNFIVAPFRDVFLYIPDVPFDKASKVIDQLNKGPVSKRDLVSMPVPQDECTDPTLGYMSRRDLRETRGVVRRQETVVPGYVTKDDWGTDGDDTEHSEIPNYSIPPYWEARASFPKDGSNPDKVDLIFFDFIETNVLNDLGAGYTKDMVKCYIDCSFTSQDFMLPYAKLAWQENKYNCPVV